MIGVPTDIAGWLTDIEAECLSRYAAGKRVLEIGSYCGRSTVCMARTADEVVSVDPHVHDTVDILQATIRRHNLTNVTMHTCTSAEWLATHGAVNQFDFVFVDGDHRYQAVLDDATIAAVVLRPGGVVAFHDYRTVPGEHDGRWDAGVTRAVDALIVSGWQVIERAGTVCLLKPKR